MKRDFWLALALVTIIPAVGVTASCSKQTVQSEPAPVVQPEAQASDESAQPVEPAQEDQLQDEAIAHESAQDAFVNERVHFAFDSAVLTDQAQQLLNGKAEYMRANPDMSVIIEGHCDERGTDAYNLALGARRADSVKQYLVYTGVIESRLSTRSYGEERPLVEGGGEAAWSENRRAQFVIN